MVAIIKPTFVQHEDDSPKQRPLSILTAQISPDGLRLATGGMDQKIKIWSTGPIMDEEKEVDPNEKKLLSTLASHNGNVLCVRWSPDSQYLASGSDDFIVIVWEKDESAGGRKIFGQTEENHEVWKPARRLVGHDSDIGAIAWSADGYYLATGSADRQVLIWDAEAFNLVRRITFHEGMVKGLAFDPTGELLASQSDDRSVCIWNTQNWTLVRKITEPFEDSPNASWFRRLSWSPDGRKLAVPNSVNNGVFVAAMLNRGVWDGEEIVSLVGHDGVIDVAAFNPISFVKDANKPHSGDNLASVLAVAARNCISIWLTGQSRPIVVFDTIVDRDTLDLSWSSDGMVLYACSSEGQLVVIEFAKKELPFQAEPDARERALATWGFQRPPRNGIHGFTNGTSNATVGTAGRPNMLQPRKKGQAATTNGQSNVLLPIPPPGAPQQITILPNGKRRIKPTFLGLGGIVAQALPGQTTAAASNGTFQPAPLQQTSAHPNQGRSPFLQPAFGNGGDVEMTDAGMHGVPVTGPAEVRASLQIMGVPSWGAPQDRPVSNALNSRKRKAAELGEYLDSPGSLTPNRPPGRTLGGDRNFEPYTGAIEELQPAYLPARTLTDALPKEEMKLAVPAIKAYASLTWDADAEEAEKLEYRNYASAARPSEIVQLNEKGKAQWLDYLPSPIVMATFCPSFSAVSCQDGTLHVYSPSGRRLMATVVLDEACSFLDSAGYYLLAITANGTLQIWDTRHRKSTFKPSSIYPLTAKRSSASGPPPTIVTAKVRSNGYPIISLSSGIVLTYDSDLAAWIELSTHWWSKGSEQWEARVRSSSMATRGAVRIMESEANDWLMAANGNSPDMDADALPPSVEGEEQEKLGNGEDWKKALTLGHLEARMNAAIVLDSLQEYKSNLVLYAKLLAEEAFRGKAEELVHDLLGPVYHRPGKDASAWCSTVLGTPKHTLLKDVLSVFGKSKSFSRLATETNETLKKMALAAEY